MGWFYDDNETHTSGIEPNKDPIGWSRPYAYRKVHPHGFSYGHGGYEGHDTSVSVSGPAAHFGIGEFQKDGVWNYGINAEHTGTAKAAVDLGAARLEFGAGTAQVGAYANKNTASIGRQANAGEAALRIGTAQNHVRVGGSGGWGWGARAHYGDTDGDQLREIGFGFDAGPVSFDLKTEAFHEGLNGLKSWYKRITTEDPDLDPDGRTFRGNKGTNNQGPSDGGQSTKNYGPVNPDQGKPKTPDHSPIDGHSGGEPLPPSNSLLDMLPSIPDGGVISNGFKSPLDLLPSLPKISLPEGPMLDGGLTSPFADLF